MIWFLRLFSQFTELEHRLVIAEAERDFVRAEMARMQPQIATAYQAHVADLRASTDFVARSKYGYAMFDRVAELPVPPEDMQPIMIGKRHAADIANELEKKFFADLNRPEDEQPN